MVYILPDDFSSTSSLPFATRISTLFPPLETTIGVTGVEVGWDITVGAAVLVDVAVGVNGTAVAVGVAVLIAVAVGVNGTVVAVAVGVNGTAVDAEVGDLVAVKVGNTGVGDAVGVAVNGTGVGVNINVGTWSLGVRLGKFEGVILGINGVIVGTKVGAPVAQENAPMYAPFSPAIQAGELACNLKSPAAALTNNGLPVMLLRS